MKRNVTRRRRARNDTGTPLLDWAEARYARRPSYAVRYLQNRRGYSTAMAKLYAGLAGLCVEEE